MAEKKRPSAGGVRDVLGKKEKPKRQPTAQSEEADTQTGNEGVDFVTDNMDENGNLPPFLDTVFGRVETQKESDKREAFFRATGESRADTYVPETKKFGALVQRFPAAKDEEEASAWDGVENGLKDAANRFIGLYNSYTDDDLPTFDAPASMEESYWRETVDDLAPLLTALPASAKAGAVAGSFAGPVGSALGAVTGAAAFLAVDAWSKIKSARHRKAANLNNSDTVMELLGVNEGEGLIPDEDAALDKLSDQDAWLRLYVASLTFEGSFAVAGAAVTKMGGKFLARWKGKNTKAMAESQSSMQKISENSRAIKDKELFPEGLENVTSGIPTTRQIRRVTKNGAYIKGLRQARLVHGLGDMASLMAKEDEIQEAALKSYFSKAAPTPNAVGKSPDYAKAAGKSLDKLSIAKSDVAVEKQLDGFIDNAMNLLQDTRGIRRVTGKARKEAIKEEGTQAFMDRFWKGSEFTGGGVRSLLDGYNSLAKKMYDVGAHNPKSPLFTKFQMAQERLNWLLRAHATRAGGELQGYNAYRNLKPVLEDEIFKMRAALTRGNKKLAAKHRANIDKFVGSASKETGSVMDTVLSHLTMARADNLVGNGALETAFWSNKAAMLYMSYSYGLTSMTNTLPVLYKGLARSIGHTVGRVVGKNGYLRSSRPWKEILLGEAYEKGVYLQHTPTTNIGKTVRAASSMNMTFLKEVDGLDRALMSHLSETQALDVVVNRMVKEGKPLAQITKEIEQAIANKDVPTDFLIAWRKQGIEFEDRMLMRGKMQPDAPYIAQLGWAIDDAAKALQGSKFFPTRALSAHIGMFSRTFANVWDFAVRVSPAGLIRPGALTKGSMLDRNFRHAALGTLTGWTALNHGFKDDIVIAPYDKDNLVKWKQFGGREGVIIDGKFVSLEHLGPLGIGMSSMAKATAVTAYLTEDDGDDESLVRVVKAMKDVVYAAINNSWVGNTIADYYTFMAGGTENSEKFGKAINEYVPGDSSIDRIATAIRGYTVPEDSQLAFTRLNEALDEFRGVPYRDAFGTIVTFGEEDEGITRSMTEHSGLHLFFFKSKIGERTKTNEVLSAMAYNGVFQNANEMKFVVDSDGELKEGRPKEPLLDTIRTIDLKGLPEELVPRLVKHPRTVQWNGESYRMKFKDIHAMRGFTSLDTKAAADSLDRWIAEYDEMAETSSLKIRQKTQSLRVLRTIKRRIEGGEYGRRFGRYVKGFSKDTRLIDVMHEVLVKPLREQTPALRREIETLSASRYRYLRQSGFDKRLGLGDRSIRRLALRLARNQVAVTFYGSIGDMARIIMVHSPSMNENKNEFFDRMEVQKGR